MPRKKKPFKLYAIWGSCDPQKGNYAFETEAERNAFIKGAQAADGWNGQSLYTNLKDRNDDFKWGSE